MNVRVPARAVVLFLIVAGAALVPAARARRHPGPPLWGEFRIEAGTVTFHLEGERNELRSLLGLAPARPAATAAELEPEIRAALLAHLHEILPVRIDGALVRPELRELIVPQEDPERWTSLSIQAELRYTCDGVPRDVSFAMDRSEGRDWFGATSLPLLIKYEKHAQMVFLTPGEPEFVWHPPRVGRRGNETVGEVRGALQTERRASLASLVAMMAGIAALGSALLRKLSVRAAGAIVLACVATAWLARDVTRVRLPSALQPEVRVPDEAVARTIFETLHGNIYRAFDVSTEDEIYDLLAVSVEPELLDALYGDIYESLILREDGGAVCVIEDVARLETLVLPAPDPAPRPAQFQVDCRWRVVGQVAHYGHVHRRVNEYRAVYTVRHQNDAWRIAAVDVKDHRRVDTGNG